MLAGRGVAGRARGRLVGPVALTVLGWLLGLGVTAAVVGFPHLVFGFHSHTAHVVLDTVDACVALLVTYLLWGRFGRTRRRQDLALAQAFVLLASAGAVQVALRSVIGSGRPPQVDAWSATSLRLMAAALVVTAALLGRERLAPTGRRAAQLLPFVVAVGLLGLLWWARDALPVALPGDPPASATRPVISGHPLLLAAQAAAACCFAAASLLVTRQSVHRGGDALVLWLGPACAVAAFARVNYFLFPSLYTDWLYTGDLLRTGSFALLLVGAAREISQHWTAWAAASVLEDRRRLARELHDGVVQELAYIRAVAATDLPVGQPREEVLTACDRAIDEARAAVDALGRASTEPLGFTLHRAAEQVADRYGARVLVDLDDSVEVALPQRHALVRITREAVSNAIRHGEAHAVCVRLERDVEGCRLVVQDDGRGFDPAQARRSTGFGLTSMRERAAALPGSFDLASEAGRGTSVTVSW